MLQRIHSEFSFGLTLVREQNRNAAVVVRALEALQTSVQEVQSSVAEVRRTQNHTSTVVKSLAGSSSVPP